MKRTIIVTFLAVTALLTMGAKGCSSTSSQSTPASQAPAAPAIPSSSAPAVTSAPTVATTTTVAAPKTLLDQQGSGTGNLEPFTVGGPWHLTYSYNCANFGSAGNFQVYVKVGGELSFDDNGPNELKMSGSGSEYEPKGGTITLQVNSECEWHVKAIG
jgi:hypothetical protein